MNMDKFLALKGIEGQRVNFEMAYVDIAGGDLLAGLLLSQIIYWFLPGKRGNHKTRVTYKGKRAIAKNREDWFKEIRLTPKQYDRAVRVLKKLNIVSVENSMFDSKRTPFITLNEEVFLRLYEEIIAVHTDNNKNDTVLPKGEDRCPPKGQTGNDQTGRPLTEITTKITSKTTKDIREFSEKILRSPLNYYEYKFSNEDKKIVVGYYMNTYEDYMQQQHPRLTPVQWQYVDDELNGCTLESGDFVDLDVPDWKRMIDQHFRTGYKNCDYNILHFVTDGVKLRRMYESTE